MKIGFYAPLKSPFSDSASGDRTIARLLIRALEIGGHEVLLMSEFRSVAISGDELQQQDLAHQGQKVVNTHGRIDRNINITTGQQPIVMAIATIYRQFYSLSQPLESRFPIKIGRAHV